MPEPPSHPSDVGAASPTRPSSGRNLTHQQPSPKEPDPAFTTLLNQSKSIAKAESFLHWEAAFPGVWRHWQNQTPEGGFDAVIGNPPWDRIKLQEVEWFATRDPGGPRPRPHRRRSPRRHQVGACATRATRWPRPSTRPRPAPTAWARSSAPPATTPCWAAATSTSTPSSSNGSLRLVKPGGLVGLLTPSGIYADRTAARFFKSVSTTGRVAGIYDFENRRARNRPAALLPGHRLPLQVLRPHRRRPATNGSPRPAADSSYPAPTPSTTPTAPSPSAPTTSPASTPTPAPPPSSAPAATPTSPAASTRPTPSWWTAQGTEGNTDVWPVRYTTGPVSHGQSLPPISNRRPTARGRWLLPRPRQSLEARPRPHVSAALSGSNDQPVRPPVASSVRYNPENTHNPYLSRGRQRASTALRPRLIFQCSAVLGPDRFWPVATSSIRRSAAGHLAFRDIARPTDVRTMISALVPQP